MASSSRSIVGRIASRASGAIGRFMLRLLSYEPTGRFGRWSTGRLSREFKQEFGGVVTDRFYELLLTSMDWAFHLDRDYRRNIKGFNGRYLFTTADGAVAAAAAFRKGHMRVHKEAIEDWDVWVRFRNAQALSSFLFSRDQDILNSLLKNDVEVHGNANYVYRFGFLSRDLTRRLGIA
jgi:hypothetical protein